MRKQDRVAAEQQNRSGQERETDRQRQVRDQREQVKGSAPTSDEHKKERESGQMPLPE